MKWMLSLVRQEKIHLYSDFIRYLKEMQNVYDQRLFTMFTLKIRNELKHFLIYGEFHCSFKSLLLFLFENIIHSICYAKNGRY